ncbi:hypothetical protein AA11825_1656 [Acetobacter pomorum DSM 11825]|nr:hypothetical protein AA11825_1656 [Acetobacter pomorum DSM 11825]
MQPDCISAGAIATDVLAQAPVQYQAVEYPAQSAPYVVPENEHFLFYLHILTVKSDLWLLPYIQKPHVHAAMLDDAAHTLRINRYAPNFPEKTVEPHKHHKTDV